jgi:hypothetical protein
MLDVLLIISKIASGLISIIVMLGLIFKPVRKPFTRWLYRGTLCLLRHEITGLYYKIRAAGELRLFEKEDLIRMYDMYKDLGGNSYVSQVYAEMMKYPVREE